MNPLTHSTKLAIGVAVLATLASSCAHVGDAGVKVQTVSADVVFGVKKKTPPAAPSSFAGFGDDFDATPVTTKKPFPNVGVKPESPCPAATVTDAPKQVSAPLVGPVRSKVGAYKWKRTGTITAPNIKFAQSLNGFETRRILNLVDKSPSPTQGYFDFTYDTAQPDLLASNVTVITHWHARHLVSDNPPLGIASVKGNRIPSNAGIFMTGVERREKKGASEVVTTFTPAPPGIQFLPQPADIGAAINSIGIDPKTLETLRVQGTIKKKVFVDACGELVDAFRVEGTQTFTSGPDTRIQTYNYMIATGRGGVLVAEEIQGKLPNGAQLKVTNSIGQIEPSPLDAEPDA